MAVTLCIIISNSLHFGETVETCFYIVVMDQVSTVCSIFMAWHHVTVSYDAPLFLVL